MSDIVLWLGNEPPKRDAIWVWARADEQGREEVPEGVDVVTSRHLPDTIANLWRVIAERAKALLPATDRPSLNARARGHVAEAVAALEGSADPLILAEELRAARVALARFTGKDATEAMLDALFGRFCIGK